MYELSRKHFFRDEQDNRTVVATYLLSTGEFGATVIETDGDKAEYRAVGIGHSRLAAIADLNNQLVTLGEDEEAIR